MKATTQIPLDSNDNSTSSETTDGSTIVAGANATQDTQSRQIKIEDQPVNQVTSNTIATDAKTPQGKPHSIDSSSIDPSSNDTEPSTPPPPASTSSFVNVSLNPEPLTAAPSPKKDTTNNEGDKKVTSATTSPEAPSIRSIAERSESYKEAKIKHRGWLTFYTVLALCTGIAMAGGAIPFFLNTTIPLLFFLSNKIVLTSLTLVQIVVWAAIYGQNNSGFMSESYWREVTTSNPDEAPTADQDNGIMNKINNTFKSVINTVFPSSALSQRFFQNKETSLKYEIAQFDEFAKQILESGEANNKTAKDQQNDLLFQIQKHVLDKHGWVDSNGKAHISVDLIKPALAELRGVYDFNIAKAADFTNIQHLSKADKARLAFQIENQDQTNVPEKNSYLNFDSGYVEVWNGNSFDQKALEHATDDKIQEAAQAEFIAAFKARRDLVNELIEKSDFEIDETKIAFNSDPKIGADKSKNMLFLAYKNNFTMKVIDVVADFVGVVNAIFVNSAGIAFSAIQLPAFFISMAAKAGIVASPMVPVGIAVFALSLGLLAGWNAAHTVTRMKTRETCKAMAFDLVYLYHNKNKWKLSNLFTWPKTYSGAAFLVAFIISVGFCCFNAVTGAVIGDTLYKLFVYHNFACITDPSIVLNPSITASTWVGKTLWWLGLLLTIPSTGAFLIGVERTWISGLAGSIQGLYDYCINQIQNKISRNYYAGFVMSVAIMPITYFIFHALGFLPVIQMFQVALLILIPSSLYLLCFGVHDVRFRSYSEIGKIIQSNIATILVLLMTFAVAAQISISTSTSPMWLFVLTQPHLMWWAGVTGFFGVIGFVYMFNDGLTGSIKAFVEGPSAIKSTHINQAETYAKGQTIYQDIRSSNNDSTAERMFHPQPAESPIRGA